MNKICLKFYCKLHIVNITTEEVNILRSAMNETENVKAMLAKEGMKMTSLQTELDTIKAKLAEEEKKSTDLNKENKTLKARLAEQEKKQAVAKGNIIIIWFTCSLKYVSK